LHLELVHYASIGGSANQISPLSIRTQNEAIRRAQESECTAHRNAAARNTYTDPGRTARRAGPWGSLVYPWWFGTTRLRFKSGRTHSYDRLSAKLLSLLLLLFLSAVRYQESTFHRSRWSSRIDPL